MTQEMLAMILPLLGFSILLNGLLLAMLLIRPVARFVGHFITTHWQRFFTTYWLGFQLIIRN